MLLVKIYPTLCMKHVSGIICSKRLESVVATSNVTPAPMYPPIEDISYISRLRKKRAEWHEEVKNVKTAEEKIIKVNIPKYYGFKSLVYEEGQVRYNELPQVQYITRTHMMKEPGLPSYYDNLIESTKLTSIVQELKQSIEDGVAYEICSRKRTQEKSRDFLDDPKNVEDMIGDAVCRQIHRLLVANLSHNYPHLLNAQTDYDPRVEAFWFFGGLENPKESLDFFKKCKNDALLTEPYDRPFQYMGAPSLHFRHQLPLNEFLPMSECGNPDYDVPIAKYDPRTMGHALKRRHGTTVSGFWPGDPCEFGLMSYHRRGYLLNRPKDMDDESDALKTHAIITNYGWLLSQACNLGFSTFNDTTYPLVNQMIITNGQKWSFSAYQLNTTLVNGFYGDENPKRNFCWITEPMKLFEKVENEKIVGFNDQVLEYLVKFYVNEPQERVGVDMKPYLGPVEQRVADYEDDEKRTWLEERYKLLVSCRPRHRLIPEMYHWEWIYKHMFKTRPMDKRRTPWDYGKNPFNRRLDDHKPKYIPKPLRPEGKIRMKCYKWSKSYYP